MSNSLLNQPSSPRVRLAVLAGTALLAGALLAGCNGETNQTGSTDTKTDTTTEVQTTDQTAEEPAFDYSGGITEDGYWEGVTALDYVTLPAYRGLEVPASQVVPTDDEVQSQIDTILSYFKTTAKVTDRAVKDGDTLNMDYVGKIDGVEFEGGNTKGNGTTVTIGVTRYIDDFLQQLIGHKPGETFDIEVTFPEDYGKEELNGKDAVFTITLNYIIETVEPELTDEWVAGSLAQYYGWTTVDQMRQEITDEFTHDNMTYYIQDFLVNDAKVSSIPESLITYQQNYLLDYYRAYASQYGMTLEDALPYLAGGVQSTDELIEANAQGIQDAAKISLVFQAIAENENIKATDEDVQTFFGEMGITDISVYEEQYGTEYLRLRTLEDMIMNLISNNAVIKDDSAQTTEQTTTADTAEKHAEATAETTTDEQPEAADKTEQTETPEQSEQTKDSDQQTQEST
ncbi:MAG: FKBP-type peptidyl-prolyl cis-trans isomerase, partial [Coriobacteriales bacterium]|nr:FKBP-type peptidyl-prolyl cis-trans isomerase [Coriobacteriales bacterium]